MTEDDKALMSVDLDARFEANRQAVIAKQARKAAVRQEFAEARKYGLRQRHAQKLARLRNQREATEPKEST